MYPDHESQRNLENDLKSAELCFQSHFLSSLIVYLLEYDVAYR